MLDVRIFVQVTMTNHVYSTMQGKLCFEILTQINVTIFKSLVVMGCFQGLS